MTPLLKRDENQINITIFAAGRDAAHQADVMRIDKDITHGIVKDNADHAGFSGA